MNVRYVLRELREDEFYVFMTFSMVFTPLFISTFYYILEGNAFVAVLLGYSSVWGAFFTASMAAVWQQRNFE